MTKLTQMLADQAKVTEEVAGLSAFLDKVHGKAPLIMEAGGEVILFEAKELDVELQILAPLTAYFEALVAKKGKLDAKVAALEVLAS